MSGELHNLEQSLKGFLIESQSGGMRIDGANSYKYNNLKLYMDPNQEKKPHFIVRLGISEAIYGIDSGERLAGGLGGDERVIRRWFERGLIKSDLSAAWTKAHKVKEVTMKEDLND